MKEETIDFKKLLPNGQLVDRDYITLEEICPSLIPTLEAVTKIKL